MAATTSIMHHDPPNAAPRVCKHPNHMWRGQFPRKTLPEGVPDPQADCAPQCPAGCPWRTEKDTCRIYKGHVPRPMQLEKRIVWRRPCRMYELARMGRMKEGYDYDLLAGNFPAAPFLRS
jgi:hypothetical protein